LRDLLAQALKSQSSDQAPVITYGYPEGDGIYPCGESCPVTGLEKSQDDRRVELVFYEKGKWSPAVPPSAAKKVKKQTDPVSEKKWEKKKGDVSAVPPVKNKFTLKITSPEKTPHKQYVNLAQNDKDEGPELKIVVDIAGAADDQIVVFEATAGDKNSKRNDPKTGLKDPANNTVVEFASKKSKMQVKVKEGKAECTLSCGLAGGDTFSIEATCEGQSGKVDVVTWRKIWYQFTHEKGVNLPEPDNSKKAFEDVGIELLGCSPNEFNKNDTQIPERTFYKEFIIECNGSEKEVAVIGSHNKLAFRKFFKKETDKPTKCHLIICQHQWDDGSIINAKAIITTNPSHELLLAEPVFKPALSGNLIISGTWKCLALPGKPGFGEHGSFSDELILIEKNRSSNYAIKIKHPSNTFTPSIISPVMVNFRIRVVKGPFLGESGAPHMLCVYDPSDNTDFKNTISHEIAHAFNQVPDDGNTGTSGQAPGLPKHPRYYYDQGGHCNTILDTNKKQTSGTPVAGEYPTGICIMYQAKDSSCINRFCDVCKEYFKANDCSGFNKK
jgi:hypothetical protein